MLARLFNEHTHLYTISCSIIWVLILCGALWRTCTWKFEKRLWSIIIHFLSELPHGCMHVLSSCWRQSGAVFRAGEQGRYWYAVLGGSLEVRCHAPDTDSKVRIYICVLCHTDGCVFPCFNVLASARWFFSSLLLFFLSYMYLHNNYSRVKFVADRGMFVSVE